MNSEVRSWPSLPVVTTLVSLSHVTPVISLSCRFGYCCRLDPSTEKRITEASFDAEHSQAPSGENDRSLTAAVWYTQPSDFNAGAPALKSHSAMLPPAERLSPVARSELSDENVMAVISAACGDS